MLDETCENLENKRVFRYEVRDASYQRFFVDWVNGVTSFNYSNVDTTLIFLNIMCMNHFAHESFRPVFSLER